MSHGRTSLLQGTLDLLILKALTVGELHGLGVSPSNRTDHAGDIPGSTRLVLSGAPPARGIGLAGVDVEPSENNRRAKYYRLTRAAQRQLGEEADQWNRIVVVIARALAT